MIMKLGFDLATGDLRTSTNIKMPVNEGFHVAGSNSVPQVLNARALFIGPLFRCPRLRLFALGILQN